MKQTIQVFGSLVDLIGSTKIEVESLNSTDELINYLQTQFPSLETKKYFLAVDKKMVNVSTELNSNSEIAIMPPFSGG